MSIHQQRPTDEVLFQASLPTQWSKFIANSHGNDDFLIQFTIELLRVDGGISKISSFVRGHNQKIKTYITSCANYFPDGIKMCKVWQDASCARQVG